MPVKTHHERLTDGERLLMGRLRKEKTQAQMARVYRMTPARYAAMEMGNRICDVPFHYAPKRLDLLQPWERCLIYRRRSGKSQASIAADLGCSRYWLNRMERGAVDSDRLVWYWEQ